MSWALNVLLRLLSVWNSRGHSRKGGKELASLLMIPDATFIFIAKIDTFGWDLFL